ncbi:MAG: 2-dehydropantoate 2-reductase [Casimicrobiaceae bacterium]
MRIAVMGSGGVGGYFGARLAAAGHPVAFIARGAHLAAIRARGLRVTSGKGDIHVPTPTVTDDPSTLAPVDVVLFAVKLWDTEDAARQVAPLVSGGGFVIPFQNGVESMTRVGAVVGPERVLGGTAHIAAKIGAPGVIEHIGTMARLRFGAAGGDAPPVAHELAAAFRSLDVDAEVVPDITRALWEKFAFLAAFSGITAASRQPIGVARADPDMRVVFEAAMREAFTVGRARGVALADDYVEGQMRFADGLPQEMKSSLLHDLAAGNRLEAPWLSGAVLRMGREAGVATPVSAALYAAVKPYLEGAGR